ncbi:MAG: DUF308 domain-containing protein [Oscillospiraceae bacterium]|nr:DUF308 domain-containing protein [Oscillospiraceae bacterium]
MKKQDILSLIQLLLVPALLILLGLILVVNPDTASVLISKLLGYALTLGAVGAGLAAVFSHSGRVRKGICAVVLAMVGGWLMMHPLWLTAWVSRFLGILIMVNSGMDLVYALKCRHNVIFHAAATAIGALLVLMPMSASRLVFTLCGVAVLVIGILMLLDRIRGRRWLQGGDDPNIIDAL